MGGRSLSILLREPLSNSDQLIRLGKKLEGGLSHALHLLAEEHLPHSTEKLSSGSLFGGDWAGHPFRYRPLFWWRLPLEPDATRMIGHICSRDYSSDKAEQRTHSFIDALQRSIAGHGRLSQDIHNAQLEMCCELVIKDNKRLDIVIRCQKTKKAFVLIEAKFGASLDNPLNIYKQYAKKSGKDNCLLVILGCHDCRTEKTVKDGWHFIHWFDFLRQWEEELRKINDCDEDFSRLRASLWSKLVR